MSHFNISKLNKLISLDGKTRIAEAEITGINSV
jgi:hypothetical protein